MSVVHENARDALTKKHIIERFECDADTHTHTQHHFCPLSNVPNKREKPRTFELSFSHSSSPSAKSYTLPISNASGSSFRFSFSCLSVSRITFRCVFNCSFDCDFPPPFVGSPTPSFFFAFGSRFFRSVPSLFSVTMSSSSNSTSRICFVPGLKSEEQKESKSSLSDAVVLCSLSLSKRKVKSAFLKHLGF